MPEHIAEVRLADDAEAERFSRLRPADAAGPGWLEHGARVAHEVVLPAITTGHYGITGRDLDRNIGAVLRAACGSQHEDGSTALDEDQRFLFRLGFEAVALPAKEAALMAVSVNAGLALAAAALQAPAAASSFGHALAMRVPAARRPLRPEDFGCLPARPHR